ncbi:hypothetical protein HB829_14075 [Listeria innocua]|uniref:hypothetical protein n=1 Tax=Listeria innocua TaxID=1642 RepID=UPI00162A041B|nr:hypothetical protein [Listeria innocua]MBC1379363.1 hypothetical protein [Listeria innocua]MBC1388513.1 hypothetical protein [Listeria innocua]
MRAYVVVDKETGYINEWSNIAGERYIEIDADESLIYNLDCVKVVRGKAVLDIKKQDEVINIENE